MDGTKLIDDELRASYEQDSMMSPARVAEAKSEEPEVTAQASKAAAAEEEAAVAAAEPMAGSKEEEPSTPGEEPSAKGVEGSATSPTTREDNTKQSLGAFHHLAPMRKPSQLEGNLADLRKTMAKEMSGGSDAPWDPFGKPIVGKIGGGGGGSRGGALGALKKPGVLGTLDAKPL